MAVFDTWCKSPRARLTYRNLNTSPHFHKNGLWLSATARAEYNILLVTLTLLYQDYFSGLLSMTVWQVRCSTRGHVLHKPSLLSTLQMNSFNSVVDIDLCSKAVVYKFKISHLELGQLITFFRWNLSGKAFVKLLLIWLKFRYTWHCNENVKQNK